MFVDIGRSLKTNKNAIVISTIISREDCYKDKVRNTKDCLVRSGRSKNISILDHSNIDVTLHTD